MKHFKAGEIPELDWKQAVKYPIPVAAFQMDEEFTVETVTGETVKGRAGDYLMASSADDLYPCAKEIFDKTYEITDPDNQRNLAINDVEMVVPAPVWELMLAISKERDAYRALLLDAGMTEETIANKLTAKISEN